MEGSSSKESNLWKTLKIISEWELGEIFLQIYFILFLQCFIDIHSGQTPIHTKYILL